VLIGGSGTFELVEQRGVAGAQLAAAAALIGGAADNLLIGGAGDDTISGGLGNDTMRGEAGSDVFINTDLLVDQIDGGDDGDYVQAELLDVVINVETTYDDEENPDGAEAVAADAPEFGARTLTATLLAGAFLSNGTLFISGTDGSDSISCSYSGRFVNVTINGQTTSFYNGDSDNLIRRLDVSTAFGDDVVNLSGMTTPSTGVPFTSGVNLGDGNDTISGTPGADTIFGGRGNDSIRGLGGADQLNGGADSISSGDGRDMLVGGSGSDYASYKGRRDNLVIRLDLLGNDDGTFGEGDQILECENVFGGFANDAIQGDFLPNFLSGGAGADTILGGGGDDKIAANFIESLTTITDSVRGEDGEDFLSLYDNAPDRYSLGAGTRQAVEVDFRDTPL
jgi:Ca2+-binding RTX toxin-like protein